jgi:ketosteroid isomerase-like protein
MSVSVPDATRGSGPRHHWVVYVAIAFAGALLTFAGARAGQRATDDSIFRKLTDDYCAAWSSGNLDNPAKFYAQDAGLIYYDLAPFSYRGWADYRTGVQKEFLDEASSVSLVAGKELKVTRHGNIAWTTVPIHLTDKTKDGKTVEMDIRYTGIWEKRGSQWLLVHEHLSAPLSH